MSTFTYDGHELRQEHIDVLEVLRGRSDRKEAIRAKKIDTQVEQETGRQVKSAALLRVLVSWGLANRQEDRGRTGWRETKFMTYWITPDGEAAIDAFKIWLQSESDETREALEPGSISTHDRQELRRLLGRRKSVLQMQLKQREADIEGIIRSNLQEMAEATISIFDDEVADFNRRARDLDAELEDIKSRASKAGLDWGRRYSSKTDSDATVEMKFVVEDLDEKVRLELSRLRAERGRASAKLEEEFLQLEEELILGSITSEGGRAFLQRVPEVDKLLPAPEDVAQQLEESTA